MSGEHIDDGLAARPDRGQTHGKRIVAHLTDTALVIRIGRRDPDAFAEVYARHGSSVHALSSRVCVDQADEVAQEVFLRLWRQPERYDPGRGSLRTFLMMQTHGRAVDVVRRDTARRARERGEPTRSPTTCAGAEITALDRIAAAELRGALSALPRPERDAIGLAYFGGYTYREVAQLLDQAEGTIKGRIRRGLSRLDTRLSDQRHPERSAVRGS